MKTLIINAHPDYKNKEHFSYKLQDLFLKMYQERFPNEKPTILNLYEAKIPRIEEHQLLTVWDKQLNNESLTTDEKEVAETSQKLLDQFKAYHRIVVVSPLHNFNVTSRMKDYIDNILIARETFRYTDDGSVGLMTDNFRALLLQASGSIYTNNDRYTPLEFSRLFLQKMFEEIMGFEDFNIVRAQGTALLDEKDVWKNVPEAMQEAFVRFYK